MFRSPTVFVLGAGASAEVDLPLGAGLLKSIVELIDIRFDLGRRISGDSLIYEAIKLHENELGEQQLANEYFRSGRKIATSAIQGVSIDHILYSLEDEMAKFIGKIGIVQAIHRAEIASNKFKSPRNRPSHELDFSSFSDTWYGRLTEAIVENAQVSDLESIFSNVAFISFNYDRCIEAFLPRSIANYLHADISEVVQLFQEVPFFRPYGIAGSIDWGPYGSIDGFGGNGPRYLLSAAKEIKIFSEKMEDEQAAKEIQSCLGGARRIIFLGSAFHRQNLEVLKSSVGRETEVFATASGISDPDLEVVREEIKETFRIRRDGPERVNFAKMHCNSFFKEHWRSLTA